MNSKNLIVNKEIKSKNKEIILNIALSLNKELFTENKISYKTFKYTEDNILKALSNYHLNNNTTNI